MLAEENPSENCALFRHLPSLSEKIAWVSLGAVRKTPVHKCRVPSLSSSSIPEKGEKNEDGNPSYRRHHHLEFYVKREDLISPTVYGGNKVRTLQHQLGVCEARREGGETAFQQLVSYGTGGSNQVVATVVHARSRGWDGSTTGGTTNDEEGHVKLPPPRINVCWFNSDAPDLDNTLNMLSVLSFPNVGFKFTWGDSVGGVGNLFRAICATWNQRDFVPMMPGGNCPSGVLGQVGAVLELAEQIEAGESPDPTRIYLPIGSGCTISGLIIGTVLVRHLGIGSSSSATAVLSHPNFQIVGCNVHEGIAMMDRIVNFHLHPIFGFMPLTIIHTVRSTCKALTKLGGPDLLSDALDFIKTSVQIRADKDVVGVYGAHSEKTRAAAKLYDDRGCVADSAGQEKEKLWLCGHFAAKAFQPLVNDLEAEIVNSSSSIDEKKAPVGYGTIVEITPPKFILWMTKSTIQPRGNINEWMEMMQENDTVKQWADEGRAESTLRPGRVSTLDGKPEDYRSLMKKIL